MTDPSEQETYRKGIDERFDHQDDVLTRIESQGNETLTQVKKTNGRVNTLETNEKIRDAEVKIIIRFLYGMGAALLFLVGQIIVPIFAAHISGGKI